MLRVFDIYIYIYFFLFNFSYIVIIAEREIKEKCIKYNEL